MKRPTRRGMKYKDLTFQQLRGFFETVRTGSMSAAAKALGISQPTVSEQVRALERSLKTKLVETRRHGSRPTPAGRQFAELIAPIVLGVDTLSTRFEDAQRTRRPRVTVAAYPRMIAEELPLCIREFERRHPDFDLTVRELTHRDAWIELESGRADLGLLTGTPEGARIQNGAVSLEIQPAYQLDLVLILPKDHPLARQRRITPKHLLGLPFVNSPHSILDPTLRILFTRLGVFETRSQQIEVQYSFTARTYVEQGFGVALTARSPLQPPHPRLHERVMNGFFGRVPVYFVRRKNVQPRPEVEAFCETVRAVLGNRKSPRPSPRASRRDT